MFRRSKTVLIGLVIVVVAVAALLYVRIRFAIPTDKLEPMSSAPGGPEFAAPNMSAAERREFLTADYRIVWKMADLPAGIRKLYTVKGGSRLAMADPGEKFQATDVLTDPDLPTRRLIFAGVAQHRAFIHYEVGGFAHIDVVELFRVEPPDTVVRLWEGYCGFTQTLADLRHCN